MKSFKTELNLNVKQISLMKQHAGVARHAWNWGLEQTQLALKNNQYLSAIDLHKMLVENVKSKYSWYYDVSKCAPQQALRNLETAWNRYFKKISKQPKFKKKDQNDSFYLEGIKIQIKGNKIKLPKIGWVKAYEFLPEILGGKNSISLTISSQAGKWFISYKTNIIPDETKKSKDIVGVDLGVKTLATLSDGKIFESVKVYRTHKKQLRRCNKALSRKIKGSNNRNKCKQKLQKIHYKIACIRKNSIHQLTSYLSKNHSKIVIENLNVSGMLKNHKLASAIADMGFYEFRRQLLYKCSWYGSELILVDRFFPSSKTCSNCGFVKHNLKLSDRIYKCELCNLTIDRDLNAAINLERYDSVPEDFGDIKSVEMKAMVEVNNIVNETIVCEAETFTLLYNII